jgi:phenylalanyl-tRNA synthetase beta chain
VKISWNWLQRHVDLTGLDPHDIANRFTMSVAELEGIEEFGATYDKVLTARIVSVRQHEGAQKLKIVELDLKGRSVTVISGAPNVAAGTIIPFAQPGVVLEGVEGKPEVSVVELKGITSPGVTCSERELGISDDHSGLLIFADDTPVGVPLTHILPVHDYILEIDNKSITHRPDLWGHRGIAREVAALVGRPMKRFDSTIPEVEGDPLTVEVKDRELCPRYAAQVFDDITIGPSPLWLKASLALVGVRPISNVVDITNFVMLDVGNPLHAFDSRFIKGETIIVRTAHEGETINTLDGVERPLLESDLLIADAAGGIALAGVMGGEESEIRDDTTRVVLEAACFDPSAIRRTSYRLGLRTEASARFEKGLDMSLPLKSTALFSHLLMEYVPGARIASRLYDVTGEEVKPTVVRVAPSYIRRRLGADISNQRMKEMLTGLEFKVREEGDDMFFVTVPPFRAVRDVGIPEDIVEEIGRLHGYDNIAPVPILASVEPTPAVTSRTLERKVKRALVGSGYAEILSYSFDSAAQAAAMGYSLEGAVELANPISSDMPVLRRHLMPNMLACAVRNAQHRDEFRLFEPGRSFAANEAVAADNPDRKEIPHQERRVAGLIYSRKCDGFELYRLIKAHVEHLLVSLGRGECSFAPVEKLVNCPWVVQERARTVRLAGQECGIVGMLSPVVRDSLKLRGKVAFFEVNLEPAIAAPEATLLFKPLPRFPAVQNDLSVIVEADVQHETVAAVISRTAGELLDELELFAVFRGEPIPEGRKSLSYHLRFRRPDRTLTDAEIEPVVGRVLSALKDEVGGEIRT